MRAINKTTIAFILLVLATIILEASSALDNARTLFPLATNNAYSCQNILDARPWYGRVNTWLWLFFATSPLIIFSLSPKTSEPKRALRLLASIGLSYAIIFLATDLELTLRQAPFRVSEITSGSSDIEIFKHNCMNTGDTQLAAALFLGWLPALIYTGWWEIAWGVYHRRVTGLIDGSFKRDWVSKAVVAVSVAIPALILGWVGWRSLS